MFSHQKMNMILEPSDGLGALWLGDIDAATDLKHLEKHGVTAVLTAAAGTRLSYRKEIVREHLIINADDVESFNLAKHFEKGVDFIDRCRKGGHHILVHCFAGISRSTTMTIAYMIKKLGFSYLKAHDHVKSRRKIICPNNGFKNQLREYERKVRTSEKSEKESADPSILPPPSPAKDIKEQNTMQKTAHNILSSTMAAPTIQGSLVIQPLSTPTPAPSHSTVVASKSMTVPTPFSIMGSQTKPTTSVSTSQQVGGGAATLQKQPVTSSSAARDGPKATKTEPASYVGRTQSVAAGSKYMSTGPARLAGTMNASGLHSLKEQSNFLRITSQQNDSRFGTMNPRKKLF